MLLQRVPTLLDDVGLNVLQSISAEQTLKTQVGTKRLDSTPKRPAHRVATTDANAAIQVRFRAALHNLVVVDSAGFAVLYRYPTRTTLEA
jgi:hypothetical protein